MLDSNTGARFDVMQVLKAETLDAHQSVERFVDVFHKDFRLSDYIELLRRFLVFYRVYEPGLRRFEQYPSLEIKERAQKTRWLEQDLEALTGTVSVPGHSAQRSIQFTDFDEALGSLYVTEGSTLGGQVMARHLSSSLGLSPEFGLRFFTGYAKATGPLWLKLGSFLRENLRGEAEISRAVGGARLTFASMEASLSSAPSTP